MKRFVLRRLKSPQIRRPQPGNSPMIVVRVEARWCCSMAWSFTFCSGWYMVPAIKLGTPLCSCDSLSHVHEVSKAGSFKWWRFLNLILFLMYNPTPLWMPVVQFGFHRPGWPFLSREPWENTPLHYFGTRRNLGLDPRVTTGPNLWDGTITFTASDRGVWILGSYQERELKNCPRLLSSFTKGKIWSFHVVILARVTKKCTKIRNAHAVHAKLLLFS